MKRFQVCGTLLLASTLFFSQLYGQSTNGSIGGTIEDATQALLPGVMVTATNVDTGVVLTSLTNETGTYSCEKNNVEASNNVPHTWNRFI